MIKIILTQKEIQALQYYAQVGLGYCLKFSVESGGFTPDVDPKVLEKALEALEHPQWDPSGHLRFWLEVQE